MPPFEYIRTRLLPALFTAGGVTMLAAGLLTYTVPAPRSPHRRRLRHRRGPSPRPRRGSRSRPSVRDAGAAHASPDPDRVATRVRIKAFDIDMPIIKGPAGYPPCDVAMYLVDPVEPPDSANPASAGDVPVRARQTRHVRAAAQDQGPDLRGNVVEVWTSDDQLFPTRSSGPPQPDHLEDAINADERGDMAPDLRRPQRDPGKTQVIAKPVEWPRRPGRRAPEGQSKAC